MHEQQAEEGEARARPGTTSLYPANIGSGGPWVRGKRRHGLAVGRGKKTYSGVLAQVLLGENVLLE